jgi:hypothetical protein
MKTSMPLTMAASRALYGTATFTDGNLVSTGL